MILSIYITENEQDIELGMLYKAKHIPLKDDFIDFLCDCSDIEKPYHNKFVRFCVQDIIHSFNFKGKFNEVRIWGYIAGFKK